MFSRYSQPNSEVLHHNLHMSCTTARVQSWWRIGTLRHCGIVLHNADHNLQRVACLSGHIHGDNTLGPLIGETLLGRFEVPKPAHSEETALKLNPQMLHNVLPAHTQPPVPLPCHRFDDFELCIGDSDARLESLPLLLQRHLHHDAWESVSASTVQKPQSTCLEAPFSTRAHSFHEFYH